MAASSGDEDDRLNMMMDGRSLAEMLDLALSLLDPNRARRTSSASAGSFPPDAQEDPSSTDVELSASPLSASGVSDLIRILVQCKQTASKLESRVDHLQTDISSLIAEKISLQGNMISLSESVVQKGKAEWSNRNKGLQEVNLRMHRDVVLQRMKDECSLIFHKSFANLPCHKDLPRLVRNIHVNENEPVGDQVHILLMSFLLMLANGFDEHKLATKIKRKFVKSIKSGNAETELQTSLLEYFEKEIGETSRTGRLLKACTQSMIAPAVTNLKQCLDIFLPYNSAPNGWKINVSITEESVVVDHIKKETAAPSSQDTFGEFCFTWRITIVLDRAVHDIRSVNCELVNATIEEEESTEEEQEELRAILRGCVHYCSVPSYAEQVAKPRIVKLIRVRNRRYKEMAKSHAKATAHADKEPKASSSATGATVAEGESSSPTKPRKKNRGKKAWRTLTIKSRHLTSSLGTRSASQGNLEDIVAPRTDTIVIGTADLFSRVILSNQRLTEFPSKLLKDFPSAKTIYLSHNQIPSIDKMSLMELLIDTRLGETLTVLRLNNNQLESVPSEIGLLKNLTLLCLQFNRLTSLPSTLGILEKLHKLDVSHNLLETLPIELCELHHLEVLFLDGNPTLKSPPPEVCEEGARSVQRYLSIQAGRPWMKQDSGDSPATTPSIVHRKHTAGLEENFDDVEDEEPLGDILASLES
mmetsp:Transcript_6199/g.18862  ORF Transcript_6199/g.18862 Transcript_6199/m.18862 type:complete len:700 (-) Transcript_6199:251-2350(-)